MCSSINYTSTVVLRTSDDYYENSTIHTNINYYIENEAVNYNIEKNIFTFQENCFYIIGSIFSLMATIYLSHKIYCLD